MFPKRDLLLSEQILSIMRCPQFIWEPKMKMTVATPESVPIHLKINGIENTFVFWLPFLQERTLK